MFRLVYAAAGPGSQNGVAPPPPPPSDDGVVWETSSIPEYMQDPGAENDEFCDSWEASLRSGAAQRAAAADGGPAARIWQAIRCAACPAQPGPPAAAHSHTAAPQLNKPPTSPGARRRAAGPPLPPWCRREAQADAASEPLLSSFLYASILSHDSFQRALAFVLSNRLSDTTLLSTELFELFYSILKAKPGITEAALADLAAVRERVRRPRRRQRDGRGGLLKGCKGLPRGGAHARGALLVAAAQNAALLPPLCLACPALDQPQPEILNPTFPLPYSHTHTHTGPPCRTLRASHTARPCCTSRAITQSRCACARSGRGRGRSVLRFVA
jgi:hypothetical protein